MDNYTVLYQAASSLIPQESKIIELGCGTGKFAKEYLKGKIKSYIGYDIDKEAIKVAETNSELEFVVADVLSMAYDEPGCTFIALEVLEHLHPFRDLELLKSLPKGSRVIFSVPSFDSADHKTFFPSEWEAIAHFAENLDIDFWRKIRIPTGGGYFHLMRGYR